MHVETNLAQQGTNWRDLIPPEHRPRIDHLVIEDGEPVDNIFAEKQHRLLTESVTSAWHLVDPNRVFQVFSDVGLFFGQNEQPLAPDVMLVLDARVGADLTQRENRSYFLWEVGRTPDIAIEFVSDRRGREEDFKLERYARIGIPYYVLFDPQDRLGGGVLRSFQVRGRRYAQLTEHRYEDVGLSLILWAGDFEGHTAQWLRWCDLDGTMLATGYEAALAERDRAKKAEKKSRDDRSRANKERKRADEAERQLELLRAKLRAQGIDPDS